MVKRVAVTIFADFEAIETSEIRLGKYMDYYPQGDIARLDILKDALYDLQKLYEEELASFPQALDDAIEQMNRRTMEREREKTQHLKRIK